MPTNESITPEDIHPRWNGLFKLGSSAALLLLVLFLVGTTGFGTLGNRFAFLQNNWLIVLFKLNIRFAGIQSSSLNVINILDLVIIALFGVLFVALYAALHRFNKIWAAIATSLPFLGMILFLVTHTAGRSGLLIGALIFSAVMLGCDVFSKAGAYMGIMASSLLFFAGDIGTTVLPPSTSIAILIGIGYVLWMIWFAVIGWRLFQLGSGKFR
jgi:hypothetical protein